VRKTSSRVEWFVGLETKIPPMCSDLEPCASGQLTVDGRFGLLLSSVCDLEDEAV
jgi:hypothetical protein